MPADVELHDRTGRVDSRCHTTRSVEQACAAARADVQREGIVAGSDHSYPVLEIDRARVGRNLP